MCVVGTPSFRAHLLLVALGLRLIFTFRVPTLLPLEAIPFSTTNNPIKPPILQKTKALFLGANDRYVRLTSHSHVLPKFEVYFCNKAKAFRGLF
jgi:hypothetical protein